MEKSLRINKIKLYLIKLRLQRPFETSFGEIWDKHALLVEIINDDNISGWGEIVSGEGPWYSYETFEVSILIFKKYIAPLILKNDKINSRNTFELLSRIRGYNMTKAGIEMAIWDLEAKLNNLSLSKFIGGNKNRIKSGVSIGIKKSVNDLINTIDYRIKEGYGRIKIKIKPGWDINVLKKVRDVFPDIALQVDGNGAYTLRQHLDLLRKIDKFNLLMIEQPLAYNDIFDHSILSRKINTPICLDESIKNISDLKTAIMIGGLEILNIKPGRIGGYSQSLKMIKISKFFQIGCWIGGMLETGIGRGHLIALASLPEINYFNDISASNRYWEEDIIEPEWKLNSDSTINVPNKPGIGVNVILDRIEQKTEKVFVFEK
ncbi:MAG: o-succinylbenzoate synthase [Thermoproteales archaeon]|nr:o-succinylbenzoate synthase [Thermoproteales archaeon]